MKSHKLLVVIAAIDLILMSLRRVFYNVTADESLLAVALAILIVLFAIYIRMEDYGDV